MKVDPLIEPPFFGGEIIKATKSLIRANGIDAGVFAEVLSSKNRFEHKMFNINILKGYFHLGS
jgi:hypothetical protein